MRLRVPQIPLGFSLYILYPIEFQLQIVTILQLDIPFYPI